MRQNVFIPKKFKSLKVHKKPPVGVRVNRRSLLRGFSGITATSYGILTWRRIETGRRFITRQFRRGKIWRQIGLTQPITAKSSKSRMGKGKGKFKAWVGYIRPGTPIYEAEIPSLSVFEEHKSAYARATHKLPLHKLKQKFPFSVKITNKKYIYRYPNYAKKKFFCFSKKKKFIKSTKIFFYSKLYSVFKQSEQTINCSKHSQFSTLLYLCFNRWCSKFYENYTKFARFYHFKGQKKKTKSHKNKVFFDNEKFSKINFVFFVYSLLFRKCYVKKELEERVKRKKRKVFFRFKRRKMLKLERLRRKNRYLKYSNNTKPIIFSVPSKRVFYMGDYKSLCTENATEHKEILNYINENAY